MMRVGQTDAALAMSATAGQCGSAGESLSRIHKLATCEEA